MSRAIALGINAPQNYSFSWTVNSPVTGVIPGPHIIRSMTVLKIDAYVTAATSVTFNIQKASTVGGSKTTLATSDVVATTSGVNTTTFADNTLANDDWLFLNIVSVSGTPGTLLITLTVV